MSVFDRILGKDRSNPFRHDSLEKRLSREPMKNHTPDNFGVFLCGEPDARHETNMNIAYDTLSYLGFKKENMYVLENNGLYRHGCPIDGPATKESIKRLFRHLTKRVDEQDFLFIYTTGHGDIRNGKSTLSIHGPDIDEVEFEECLRPITAKLGVLIADQCYSEGFARRIGKGIYVAVSASDAGQPSIDNTFPLALYNGMANATTDMNSDGIISLEEAFIHAANNDYNSRMGNQRPRMFFSDTNPKNIFLNFLNRRETHE